MGIGLRVIIRIPSTLFEGGEYRIGPRGVCLYVKAIYDAGLGVSCVYVYGSDLRCIAWVWEAPKKKDTILYGWC